MTEHKYTDEEVIRGIECCIIGDCGGCPINTGSACRDYLFEGCLAIIKRQRAEIDDLKRDTIPKLQWSLQRANEMGVDLEVELKAMWGAANSYKMHYENAKSEAIKEFAERLNNKLYYIPQHHFMLAQVLQDIKSLVIEMTEGTE